MRVVTKLTSFTLCFQLCTRYTLPKKYIRKERWRHRNDESFYVFSRTCFVYTAALDVASDAIEAPLYPYTERYEESPARGTGPLFRYFTISVYGAVGRMHPSSASMF